MEHTVVKTEFFDSMEHLEGRTEFPNITDMNIDISKQIKSEPEHTEWTNVEDIFDRTESFLNVDPFETDSTKVVVKNEYGTEVYLKEPNEQSDSVTEDSKNFMNRFVDEKGMSWEQDNFLENSSNDYLPDRKRQKVKTEQSEDLSDKNKKPRPEEKIRKDRERCKRYRDRQKSLLSDENEKIRRGKKKLKCQRYGDQKKANTMFLDSIDSGENDNKLVDHNEKMRIEGKKRRDRERSQRYRNRTKKLSDAENKRIRREKNKEKCKRYRAKKKAHIMSLKMTDSGEINNKIPDESERIKREKNKEKCRRYRELKRTNTLCLKTVDSGKINKRNAEEDERIRREKNKEKCKRYRERKKANSLSMKTVDPGEIKEEKRKRNS